MNTNEKMKLIHGRIAFEYMETSGDATRLINILESNRVFACYLEKINNICTALGKKIKRCADLFEVIVGAIFYTYFYMDGDYNIIQKIEQWNDRSVGLNVFHLANAKRKSPASDELGISGLKTRTDLSDLCFSLQIYTT